MEDNSTTTQGQGLFQHAIRFGAILGGIGILITVLLYVADFTLLADWKFGIGMLLLYLGLVIYAGINYRNQIGGYLAYGKAFQHGYVTLVVGGLVGTIFGILLYTVIDPDLPQALADVTVEKTGEMMKKFGAPEDQIEEQLDKMRVDLPKQFSALGSIKQFGWGLIINAVISAITSLFVRKNQPEIM
ncbi:MAG: DUF4199 domain-containing protein [Cyclobacteriaceae bacterium]|nr:DUF4199 domain-containing protein [Cyclobacteriaceae bacterium]